MSESGRAHREAEYWMAVADGYERDGHPEPARAAREVAAEAEERALRAHELPASRTAGILATSAAHLFAKAGRPDKAREIADAWADRVPPAFGRELRAIAAR